MHCDAIGRNTALTAFDTEICAYSPNTAKLSTAPQWHEATVTPRYLPRLVVQNQIEASANLTYPTGSGMEIVPTNEYDRLSLWASEEVIGASHQ